MYPGRVGLHICLATGVELHQNGSSHKHTFEELKRIFGGRRPSEPHVLCQSNQWRGDGREISNKATVKVRKAEEAAEAFDIGRGLPIQYRLDLLGIHTDA